VRTSQPETYGVNDDGVLSASDAFGVHLTQPSAP